MTDARVVAWVAAWEQLQAATKFQKKYPDSVAGECVDRMHRVADILARLAAAPTPVGEGAHAVIVEQDRERKRHEASLKDFLEDS